MSYTLKCDDGDLIVNAAGGYSVIFGLEKVAQDIAESLLNNTDPDAETYYNGSELYQIGDQTTILSTIGVEEWVHTMVMESMERLMDNQDEDDYIDEEESIDTIRELTVEKVGFLSWRFMLRVITESAQNVPMNFDIALSQQLPDSLADEFDQYALKYQISSPSFY